MSSRKTAFKMPLSIGVQDFVRFLDRIHVPEAQHGDAGGPHVFVAPPISRIIDVLAAVDFDDQTFLPAHEVGEIWPYRKLANELMPAQSPVFQFRP